MSDTSVRRVECLVRGRVQGVWFRKSTQDVAAELALSGWVRNLADGRVEAVAEGPEHDVVRFVQWLWVGPEQARVDHVDVRSGAATGAEPRPFALRPSGPAA